MTDPVVAGETPKARIDWAITGGSEFVVPLRWLSGSNPVDLSGATATVLFSAAPTGGIGPVTADASVVCSSGAGGTPNMVITIHANKTTGYDFAVMRYALIVTLSPAGPTRWAEGDITYEGVP